MEVINSLNTNSGAITGIAAMITAFATVVLVGITGFYAWVTKKMLEENRQMHLDAQKPQIAIYLLPDVRDETSVCLCVENIGVGPAYDVKFTTNLSFSLPGNHLLGQQVPFLGRGIRYLPPRKIRKVLLGSGLNLGMRELMQKQLEIAAVYKDSMRKKCKKSFCLDFREHGGG